VWLFRGKRCEWTDKEKQEQKEQKKKEEKEEGESYRIIIRARKARV